MPVTKTEDLKEGGFAQVREVLQKFKGKVTSAPFDLWGGQLVDPATGKSRPPREYFELNFTDVEVLEATDELSMDISEQWSVRINCSAVKNSFWGKMFLPSAEANKIVVPDGFPGKILTMEKQTYEADDAAFNKTDWVVVAVEEGGNPAPKTKAAKAETTIAPTATVDPMAFITELAIGKSEDELKTAIAGAKELQGSPVLPLAKTGMITQQLVNDGKLALVDGKYQKPA